MSPFSRGRFYSSHLQRGRRSAADWRSHNSASRLLRFEPLEDRRLLANVVVSNTLDVVNGNTTTIVDLIADDGGDGISLREAILAANANPDADSIAFSVSGVIELSLGELAIGEKLSIDGPGANVLAVDAMGASRVFMVDDGDGGNLLNVSISGLTITGGLPDGGGGDGGGILNREALTVSACHITNNTADDGGGIANFFGSFVLLDSTLSANTATGASGGGGGIFNFSSAVGVTSTISNSTISNNEMTNSSATSAGGGVYNFLGTLNIELSTITENSAPAARGSGVATLGDPSAAQTRVHSSIVAGNANSDLDRVVGAVNSFQSLGYNLVGTGTSVGAFFASGDQTIGAADPLLSDLGDFGGPTPTHAVIAGSLAIDAGDPDIVAGEEGAPLYDQRGKPFGRVSDDDGDGTPQIDAGAFESHLLAYVVDTLDDESDGDYAAGDLSLREAIELANSHLGFDEIQFSPDLFTGVPVVIQLTLGELTISDAVAIYGPGAAWLTIDAQQNSRIFNVSDGDNLNAVAVAISRLTLTGGHDVNGGGAVFSDELLTVSDSVITGNTATWGGGLYNGFNGELTLQSSQVSGNSATSSGGGIYNWSGTTHIRDSSITANMAPDAAGIHNSTDGYLSVERATISGNVAAGTGGGIRNDGQVVISDNVIAGNEAAAGAGLYVWENSYTSITRSTISGNTSTGSGGGIFSLSATTYLLNSLLSKNTGTYGGGLYIAGSIDYTVRITNSTISGNTATISGGGIYNFGGSAIIEHTTITKNHAPDFVGSGIATQHPGFASIEMYHTIAAGNDHTDLALTAEINSFVSLGYNLVGALGPAVDTFVETGDQILGDTDPRLGPLADNGGPTMTHALLFGSPAIDAGDPSLVAGEMGVPLYDQRGEGFDRVRDGDVAESVAIDIGAFEVQEPLTSQPALLGDYNQDETVNAADYTVWRNTTGQTGVEPYSGADGNGDGQISFEDYLVWKQHYGETLLGSGTGVEAASVSPTLFKITAAEDPDAQNEARSKAITDVIDPLNESAGPVATISATSPESDLSTVMSSQFLLPSNQGTHKWARPLPSSDLSLSLVPWNHYAANDNAQSSPCYSTLHMDRVFECISDGSENSRPAGRQSFEQRASWDAAFEGFAAGLTFPVV